MVSLQYRWANIIPKNGNTSFMRIKKRLPKNCQALLLQTKVTSNALIAKHFVSHFSLDVYRMFFDLTLRELSASQSGRICCEYDANFQWNETPSFYIRGRLDGIFYSTTYNSVGVVTMIQWVDWILGFRFTIVFVFFQKPFSWATHKVTWDMNGEWQRCSIVSGEKYSNVK